MQTFSLSGVKPDSHPQRYVPFGIQLTLLNLSQSMTQSLWEKDYDAWKGPVA